VNRGKSTCLPTFRHPNRRKRNGKKARTIRKERPSRDKILYNHRAGGESSATSKKTGKGIRGPRLLLLLLEKKEEKITTTQEKID